MKLAVIGAAGRMGASILRLAQAAEDIQIVGACDSPNSIAIGKDAGEVAQAGNLGVAVSSDVHAALLGADVCIDFSAPAVFNEVARAVAKEKVAWVCGTTGLPNGSHRLLEEASKRAAVLWAPNMSFGIEVLAELVREAIQRLGSGYDVEIVETHHRRKTDAPSGTAKRLAEAVQEARKHVRFVHGREGVVGARAPDEVSVLALRGGDVVGDHSVHLLGDGERLELTHRATNRDLFAHGAIRAARFLIGKPPGMYTIQDVLTAAPAPELH